MIFVTGDTHGGMDIKKLSNKRFPYANLNRKDYIIITGDFGFIFDDSKEEQWWIKWLCKKNCTFLFVDGNHENFERLNSYKEDFWNGGKVHLITDNIIHLMRGQVFNIEGNKIFTFGGATSIDKENRNEYISWWKEELPNNRELDEGIMNLEKNNWNVDYVISHCCSSKTLKTVSRYCKFSCSYKKDVLNKYFDFIESKLKYKHWYFGHYHIDIKNVVDNQSIVFNNIIQLR